MYFVTFYVRILKHICMFKIVLKCNIKIQNLEVNQK